MLFKVRDLEIKPIRFETSFRPGEIDLLDASLRQVTPLDVRGSVEWLASVAEIHLTGELKVGIETECDRCLEPARFGVEQKLDLFYRSAESLEGGHEVGIEEGETEVGFFEGEGLELTELLREQVLLGLPVQRLCREGCKGLCPECGGNLNKQDCGCAAEFHDERFAVLKSLRIETKKK